MISIFIKSVLKSKVHALSPMALVYSKTESDRAKVSKEVIAPFLFPNSCAA